MNQDRNNYVDVTSDEGRLRSSQRHGPRPASPCSINKLQQMLLGLILLTRREECSLGHFRIYISVNNDEAAIHPRRSRYTYSHFTV